MHRAKAYPATHVGFVIAIALAAAACKDASTKPAAAAPLDHAGADTYARFCAPCHADDATGYKADHAPSLVNSTFLDSATDSFLIDAIEQGRPGTSMAAYSQRFGGPLDGVAITGLVAWIRSHGSAPQPLAPLAAIGDASHGAQIYADKCQTCHGTPDVRGEFVSLSNPRFLATASDAFLAHAIENGRPGTKMQAWQGVLAEQDIADVIAFVRSRQRSVAVQRLPAPTGTEPLFVNPTGTPPRFVGHTEHCTPGPGCKTDPRYVSAADVKRALDDGKRFVIVDARPASEWMTVHVTGAVSISYSDMKRLDEIPKDAWVIAYCACPHHLSGIVVDELQRRGYPHAFVLDEGINFWQRQGYPVVAAPGAPMPPAEPH